MKQFLVMRIHEGEETWEGTLTGEHGVSTTIDMIDVNGGEVDVYYLDPISGVPRPVEFSDKFVLKADKQGYAELMASNIYVGNEGSEEYEIVGTVVYTDH